MRRRLKCHDYWEDWHTGVRLTAPCARGDTRRLMPDPEQQEARTDFADRRGVIGPYGVRYSWPYWLVILAARR